MAKDKSKKAGKASALSPTDRAGRKAGKLAETEANKRRAAARHTKRTARFDARRPQLAVRLEEKRKVRAERHAAAVLQGAKNSAASGAGEKLDDKG